MAEDLLLITRAESRLVEPHRRRVDLDGLVTEALEHERRRCEQKGLAVEAALDARGRSVSLDPQLGRRVLAHLLDNAVRFSPHGGSVRVATAIEDGRARVTVQDSGPGLSAADLEHLFEPFYRADAARPRDTGVGLGLAVARAVVDLHGGRIRAGNAPGGGARFDIDLPLDAPPPEV